MPYPLFTPRLLIAPLAAQDTESFVTYRQDAEVARWQGWERFCAPSTRRGYPIDALMSTMGCTLGLRVSVAQWHA